MLSIPHMIVVFIVVLVVFGPQKLPELARTLGKLMAEFRKASGDFRSAFEEEMRDLERQARVAELKKQTAEANAAAAAAEAKAAPPAVAQASLTATEDLPASDFDARVTEAPEIRPSDGAIPRIDAGAVENEAKPEDKIEVEAAADSHPSHDQQHTS